MMPLSSDELRKGNFRIKYNAKKTFRIEEIFIGKIKKFPMLSALFKSRKANLKQEDYAIWLIFPYHTWTILDYHQKVSIVFDAKEE